MSRGYRHIKEYEAEILRLKEQGYTKREIGEKHRVAYEQTHNFISRHNEKQRKFAVVNSIKEKRRIAKGLLC